MAKYSDSNEAKSLVGGSNVSRYIPNEKAQDRHQRRLRQNLKAQEVVNTYCNEKSIKMSILNNGHHWKFEKDGFLIEWWPSSAKLVINKNYKNGIHTHGYDQLLKIVEKEFTKFFGEN